VAFGGTGWSARQRFLFDRECARQDAPVLFIGGIRSLGPLLIEQGTSEQRARFLTPMLSGRDLWCHGHGQASLRSSRHHLFGHQRDAAQPYSPSDIDQSLGVRDRSLDLGRLALAWIKYIRQAPLVGLMFDAHIQKR
jgi:hypothetical protein